MSLTQSTAFNEYGLAGRAAYLDLGAGSGRIRIYNGTRPAFNGTATTLLAEITLTEPCGTVASNVLTLTAAAAGVVLVSGTATWARVVNGNGDTAFDCTVTATGGGGEITLSNVAVVAGGSVTVTSAVLG